MGPHVAHCLVCYKYVSVSLSYYNTMPQPGKLINNPDAFLTVLQIGNSEIRSLHVCVLVRAPFNLQIAGSLLNPPTVGRTISSLG